MKDKITNGRPVGRPTLPERQRKVAININLPPDIIAHMDAQWSSRGILIETAYREFYKVYKGEK